MAEIKTLFRKYREQIAYVFFGGLTTIVNIIVYYLSDEGMKLGTVPSTAIAQVAAVLFAYVTNRKFVFHSNARGGGALLREMGSFFACRAVSFFLDIGIMWLTVDIWGWAGMIMKIVSNVIIIVINYVASKLLIFNRGADK